MSENKPKLRAALVIACAALAVSIYAARGARDAKEPGANACIDREARAQLDTLHRALAERDAVIAWLAPAANAPGDTSIASSISSSIAPEPSSRPVMPPVSGPRRYARFETPNPAVSMTQKPDGTYDIHTTDPALAGAVMQVTAVTQSGRADKLLIRIPSS